MIPVALFVYNRPDHLKKVLKALRAGNGMETLYIFSDQFKNGNAVDERKVGEVRKIVRGIDWVKTEIFNSAENKGVDASIIFGVNKIMSLFDKVIVLEDDCLPAQGFYNFMCQCLKQYERQENVSCVCGYSHPVRRSVFRNYHYDVFYWQRFWSWGWGTWRRVWNGFTPNLDSAIAEIKSKGIDTKLFGNDISLDVYEKIAKKNVPWDAPFLLTMILKDSFAVYPVSSYIKNIGLDNSGVHSRLHDLRFAAKLNSVLAGVRDLRFPAVIDKDPAIIAEIKRLINNDMPYRFYGRLRRLTRFLYQI